MRTTIDIEDDLLLATKELARKERVSAGKVVSRLLRAALSGIASPATGQTGHGAKKVGGFRPFAAADSRIVTNDQVNQLRDDEGI